MSSLDGAICAFAGPGVPLEKTRALVSSAVLQQLRVYVLRFLERTSTLVEYAGVEEFVAANWERVESRQAQITPAVGQLGLADTPPGVEGARVALAMASLGALGPCTVCPERAFVGYFGARPAWVQVGRSELQWPSGVARDASWGAASEPASDCELFRDLHPLVRPPFAFDRVGVECPVDDFLGSSLPYIGPRHPVDVELRSGLDLLSEAEPQMAKWAAVVIRGVVTTRVEGGGTSSGSSERHPGLIFLSSPMCPEQIATQIVHEASHQYLNLLNECVPLTDRSSQARYYSPFRRTGRPLYGVLLALHAATNMARFLMRLREGGFVSKYVDAELKELIPARDQMLTTVLGAPDLSAAGRAFAAELHDLTRAEYA